MSHAAPPAVQPKVVSEGAALWALMLGNFVIGTGVLVPAGMANTLMAAFNAPASDVGHLTTYGAVVLCLGAPLFAFVTTGIDRRLLLVLTLALYAAGHAASALMQSLNGILIVRLVMISAAAIFTPQAAATASLFIPPERRPAAITFVFLGWSLAAAFGMPLAGLIGARLGWPWTFWILAVLSAASLAYIVWTLPKGLMAAPMSGEAWRKVLTSSPILIVLAVTAIQLAGQFVLFPYAAPELSRLTAASPEIVAIALGLFGVAGAAGSAIATRYVGALGTANAVAVCLGSIIAGLLIWSGLQASPAIWACMIAFVVWGLGFSAANALQQARLIAIAPPLAAASVALNTSAIYVGQAAGAAIGGQMIDAGQNTWLGVVGLAFVAAAVAVSWWAKARWRA